jgi:hypothetical protein
MNNTSQIFESYVPVYDTVPETWEDARPFLVEQLKRISNAVNIREIGWFLDEELLSGKQFIPTTSPSSGTAPQFRTVLRKVVDFGPLPNAGDKTVAHGIQIDANFTLIQLWAAATDPVGLTSFNIDHSSPTLNENIKLYLDSQFIHITTGANFSNYTRCFVFIEYIQEL